LHSPVTKQFLAESKKKEISQREERLLNGVPASCSDRIAPFAGDGLTAQEMPKHRE